MFSLSNKSVSTDKRRMLNTAIALSAALLVVWVFMLQQQAPSSNAAENTVADSTRDTRLDSLRLALGSDFPLSNQKKEDDSATDGVLLTFLLLASAVGGLWWFTRKQRQIPTSTTHELMKEVARQELAVGQELVVMEFNNEYWFFSLNTQSFSLLQRIAKTEIPTSAFDFKTEEKSSVGFQQIMHQLKGGKKHV